MPLSCSLSEAVVAVTGASHGVGAATAIALAASGAHVVLVARRAEALVDVAKRCEHVGGSPTIAVVDVTDAHGVRAVAEEIYRRRGRLDGWVNNAAVGAYGIVERVPSGEFRRVLDVNVLGYVHGVAAALPYLRRSGGGVIVNVASLLGKISLPYQAPYVAAKHAVVGLSAALRLELRAERETTVSVCTVLPAGLDTPSSTTPPTTLEGHSGRHRRCTTRIG